MLTIAWDVDDVLNDLMRSWFEDCWLHMNPSCDLVYDDLKENPPEKILGITRHEYLQSLDTYRLSGAYQTLVPCQHLLGWFQKYGHNANHIAVTAVPICTVHISSFWVLKYFGQWIRSFHFVPSNRTDYHTITYDRSKAELISRIGQVDILVEDNKKNAEDFRNMGGMSILIHTPWSETGVKKEELLKIISEKVVK